MKIGIIYKIVHNQSNKVYVGSTLNKLRYRWRNHKYNYRHKIKHSNCSVYNLFDKYGLDNFTCILIKQYNIVDRIHLRAYEQLWINKLNSINKNASMPFLWKKLYHKEYYKKYCKKYKKYYRENKEKINEYTKEYYKKNRDKLAKKYKCICGSEISKYNKSKHVKTKKHILFMSSHQ